MKKKDMSFIEIFNKQPISLLGDVDDDNVPNILDCKPMDPDRDGLFGRIVNVVSGGRYGQSQADYEAEKLSKISRTHFERDPKSGKVVKVFRNGEEVSPSEKSSDQLLREYKQDQLKESLERQKVLNELAKQKLKHEELKMKERKLLLKKKQSSQDYYGPSAANQAMSMILGIPQSPKGIKPPKGLKKKKGSKAKTAPGAVCNRCGTPLMLLPGMFGYPVLMCPHCM